MKIKNFSNISLLIFFICFVFLLIVSSITYRVVRLIQNSSFASSAFNILIISKDVNIIHIDKSTGSLSIIDIKDGRNVALNKTKLENSIFFHAPINGEITLNDTRTQNSLKDLFTFKQILNVFFVKKDISFLDFNEIDFLKAYFFTKGVKNSDIETKSISLGDFSDTGKVDDSLFELLKNQDIINEKESVEIINATDIDGLGAKVSQMLKNVGFNVVSVATSDTVSSSKIIGKAEKTTTPSLILDIFRFPKQIRKEASIADITVVLGQDIKKRIKSL